MQTMLTLTLKHSTHVYLYILYIYIKKILTFKDLFLF